MKYTHYGGNQNYEWASPRIDYETIGNIRDSGLERSQHSDQQIDSA